MQSCFCEKFKPQLVKLDTKTGFVFRIPFFSSRIFYLIFVAMLLRFMYVIDHDGQKQSPGGIL